MDAIRFYGVRQSSPATQKIPIEEVRTNASLQKPWLQSSSGLFFQQVQSALGHLEGLIFTQSKSLRAAY